ncbi:unnamed protein product [Mytilus coruscus]|uniref:Uncharacterized protein n=1 Tax=Mytilus coruscus TaxID=42192 RepID=A0A6J8BYF2_MYTCO|nr:unnamed protein product [Mytilus coruscus]
MNYGLPTSEGDNDGICTSDIEKNMENCLTNTVMDQSLREILSDPYYLSDENFSKVSKFSPDEHINYELYLFNTRREADLVDLAAISFATDFRKYNGFHKIMSSIAAIFTEVMKDSEIQQFARNIKRKPEDLHFSNQSIISLENSVNKVTLEHSNNNRQESNLKKNVQYEQCDNKDTVKYSLEILHQNLNVGQDINHLVVVGDGKTYDLLVKLKGNMDQDLIGSSFSRRLAHTKKLSGMLMKLYLDAGLKDFIEIFHQGATANSVIQAVNFDKTQNFLLQFWESLFRFQIETVIKYFHFNHEQNDHFIHIKRVSDILSDDTLSPLEKIQKEMQFFQKFSFEYEELLGQLCEENENWRFWNTFLSHHCFTYIAYFIAIRSGNWELRNFCIKEVTKITQITESKYYARLLPYHIADLKNFPAGVIKKFEEGAFVVNISGRNIHSQGLDEAHESCINREVKDIIKPKNTGFSFKPQTVSYVKKELKDQRLENSLLRKQISWSKNQNIPLSDFQQFIALPKAIVDSDGLPYKGDKSKTLKIFRSRYPDSFTNILTETPQCVVIDGMFFVHTKPLLSSHKTFTDYIIYLYKKCILPYFDNNNTVEVHLVFDDQSPPLSPKDIERNRRDLKNENTSGVSFTKSSKLPSDWLKFLTNRNNKKQLVLLISEQFLLLSQNDIKLNQTFVVGGGFDNSSLSKCVVQNEIRVIKNFQTNISEGDSRVWLHTEKTLCDTVLIYSPDNDTYNIGLPFIQTLDKQVFVQLTFKKDVIYLNMNKLTHSMKNDPDLQYLSNDNHDNIPSIFQMLYIVTGCDYVSFFRDHDKTSFYQIFFKYPDCITSNNIVKGWLGILSDSDNTENAGFLAF